MTKISRLLLSIFLILSLAMHYPVQEINFEHFGVIHKHLILTAVTVGLFIFCGLAFLEGWLKERVTDH